MEAVITRPGQAATPSRQDARARRETARSARNEISSYHLATTYAVREGKLYVTVPGGILPEQRELITKHRDALIELFTTPPGQAGQCIRGHAIQWTLDSSGIWLCGCYYGMTDYHQLALPAALTSQESHELPAVRPILPTSCPPVPSQEPITEELPTVKPSEPEPSQENRAQWGVVFADIHAGQAVSEQGACFSFPGNCSLSTFITAAIEQIGPVNRVYICGPRPGDGTGPESYINWLLDPAMMERYTTSKIGHFLDGNKPDMFVARYQFRVGRGSLDIRRINAWLGDDRDSNDHPVYTIEDARAALALLTAVLRQHFPLFRNLSGTPSTTFKHLWTQGNHIAKKQFPPLPDEIRSLIHRNAGQGRIEYFAENCQGKLPGLFYNDGIFMYAALAWGLGTEIESHDTEPVYAGKQPARYRIRYTVPNDWQHVGLFMTKREGSSWRDKDGWWYPGRAAAGQTFETWVEGSELDVCVQHYSPVPVNETTEAKRQAELAGRPRAFKAWNIEILERIIYKPEKESVISKPLETITRKMVSIREQFEADKRQDAKNARVYDLARGAARNILLHGIGSFNREQKRKTYLFLPGEQIPMQLTRETEYTVLEDGRQLIITPEETEPDEMMHPEWAAAVWGRCRARVTKEALSIPFQDLITIRTDAIATKSRQARLENGTRPGQFRRKWAIEKPLTAPATNEQFDNLQRRLIGK